MIIICDLDKFRQLMDYQIELADLIVVEHKNSGFVYKALDKSNYFDTWENIAKLVVNTLAFRHVIYIPNGFK